MQFNYSYVKKSGESNGANPISIWRPEVSLFARIPLLVLKWPEKPAHNKQELQKILTKTMLSYVKKSGESSGAHPFERKQTEVPHFAQFPLKTRDFRIYSHRTSENASKNLQKPLYPM